MGQHRGVTESRTEPAKRQLPKTVRDMALSMGIVAGIIFLVLLLTWRPQPDPVRAVDPGPAAQTAQIVADFPLVLPRVPAGWQATSARFEPTEESDELPVWFTGWVGPGDQYVAVVQSENDTESFIEEQTLDGLPAEDAPPTPGWQPLTGNDQRSLVRTAGGVTTIVTGTLPWPELIAFRDSLRPLSQKGASG